MESQDEEDTRSVWKIYLKEWAIASPQKRIELNKRILRWQELMKNGWTASKAYYRVMEEHSNKPSSYSFWSWMRKAPFVILGLALIASIVYCVVITRDRDALKTELEPVQSVLASTQSELNSTTQTLTSTKQTLASTQVELNSTTQTLASTQVELTSTQQTLASAQAELTSLNNTLASVRNELDATNAKLEAMEEELKHYKETLGVAVFYDMPPPYKGGDVSREINLINNPIAANPTWQELKAFLLADPTDDEYYIENLFICGDFAEMLHNNAEAAGIKAAFVAVHFSDTDLGHALNAFKTTDKGLVYVDGTGEGFQLRAFEERQYERSRPTDEEQQYKESRPTEWDKIAYLVKGKEYGSISLGENTLLDYDSYEKMKVDWHSYVQKLEAYNEEVKEFNKEIFGKVYYIETIEWRRINEWQENLEDQERVLDSLRAQLETMWNPLGIVTNIEIYW